VDKKRHKIYRYVNTSYQGMLDKEAALLTDVQACIILDGDMATLFIQY
jgi:hypothetical protein